MNVWIIVWLTLCIVRICAGFFCLGKKVMKPNEVFFTFGVIGLENLIFFMALRSL